MNPQHKGAYNKNYSINNKTPIGLLSSDSRLLHTFFLRMLTCAITSNNNNYNHSLKHNVECMDWCDREFDNIFKQPQTNYNNKIIITKKDIGLFE